MYANGRLAGMEWAEDLRFLCGNVLFVPISSIRWALEPVEAVHGHPSAIGRVNTHMSSSNEVVGSSLRSKWCDSICQSPDVQFIRSSRSAHTLFFFFFLGRGLVMLRWSWHVLYAHFWQTNTIFHHSSRRHSQHKCVLSKYLTFLKQ